MKRLIYAFVLATMTTGALLAQTVLYSENFSTYADGIGLDGTGNIGGYPMGVTKWSVANAGALLLDASDFIKTLGGAIKVQDAEADVANGGVGVVWTSQNINIANYTNVGFSLYLGEVGDHENLDYVDVAYSTNGGATFTTVKNWDAKGDTNHTLIGDIPNDADWDSARVSVNGLTGSVFVLRITFSNNSGSEIYTLDDVLVKGTFAQACAAPTTQASGFATTAITASQISMQFVRGNGARVLVLAKKGSPVIDAPTDGKVYVSNTTFGAGDSTSAGTYVVYNGTANGAGVLTNAIAVKGLMPSSDYHFAVFEFATTNGTCYNPAALKAMATTTCNIPTEVMNPTVAENSTKVTINWMLPVCYSQVMAVVSASPVNAVPTGDGIAYTAKTKFGTGTDLGNGQFVVYKGAGTNVTVTGLKNGTPYYITIFVRRGNNWSAGVDLMATPQAPPAVMLNELLIDPTSGDDGREFVELKGAPNTSLNNVTFIAIEGEDVNAGLVDEVILLTGYSLGNNGLLLLRDNNGTVPTLLPAANAATPIVNRPAINLENGANSYLLVYNFTGSLGMDLDVNNDGVFDVNPWSIVLDSLGFYDGGSSTDRVYGNPKFPRSNTGQTIDALFRNNTNGEWVGIETESTILAEGPFYYSDTTQDGYAWDSTGASLMGKLDSYSLTPGNENSGLFNACAGFMASVAVVKNTLCNGDSSLVNVPMGVAAVYFVNGNVVATDAMGSGWYAKPSQTTVYVAHLTDNATGCMVMDTFTIVVNSCVVVCDAPTNFQAFPFNATQAQLGWNAVANANTYYVRYRVANTTTFKYKTFASNITQPKVTGLIAGATYEFSVRTNCATKNSVWSPVVTFKMPSAGDACGVVQGAIAVITNGTKAKMIWTFVQPATGYRLRYREVGATVWISKSPTTNNFTATLVAGKSYEMEVRTVCGATLTNYSTTFTFTVPAAGAAIVGANDVNNGAKISGVSEIGSLYIGNNEMIVFPNPTSDELNIRIDANTTERLVIADAMGKIVRTWTVNNDVERVNVSELASGVYTISRIGKDGQKNAQLFVKE